jgi:hypothetical protein
VSVPFPDDLELLLRSDAGLYSDLAGTTPATADGTAIALWKDQSGNFNHLAQATSGARPLVKTNQISGLPCVRFDGSDDFFWLTSAFVPAGHTMYALLKIPGTDVYTIISGRPKSLQWRMDGGKQRLVESITTDLGFGSGTMAAGTWTQVNASWDFTNGVFRMAGASDGAVSVANKAGEVWKAVGANIGAFDGRAELFAGDMACLAVYAGVHSTGDRQTVEAWITAELGV